MTLNDTHISAIAGLLSVCFLALTSPALLADGKQGLSGTVQSGADAVPFASVQLMLAGRQVQGARVIGRSVADAQGKFTIQFKPPKHHNAVLYLVADGSSGLSRNKAERAAGSPTRLATMIGEDPYPDSFVINERTTVATAYAMAQFISGQNIGGPHPGMPNAATIVRNLVNIENGDIGKMLAESPNGSETTAMPTVNSLANMLAACVRDAGRCAELFDYASPPSGPPPHDTLAAIVNIAHYPGQNVAELLTFSEVERAYSPALKSDASDDPDADGYVNSFILALRYIGGDSDNQVLDGPGNIAFDEHGNAWVNNNYVYSADPKEPVCGSTKLIKLTPTGEYADGAPFGGDDLTQDGIGAGGLYGAGFGVGVDAEGNVWVSNFGFQGQSEDPLKELCPNDPAALAVSVSKFDADGNPLSPDGNPSIDLAGGYEGAGPMLQPQGVKSDRQGNVWVVGCIDGTVTRFNGGDPNNVDYLNAADMGLNFDKGFDLAFDKRGHAFVTGNGSSTVLEINRRFEVVGDPIEGFDLPMGVASDSAGNLWVADAGLPNPPCPPALAEDPTEEIGNDGADNLRAAVSLIRREHGLPVVTRFTKKDGRRDGLRWPWGIAVDGNDNVWVANFAGQRIMQLCGAQKANCPPGIVTGEPISPDTGWYNNALERITGIQIDPSGNVWMANNWLLDAFRNPENPGGHQVVLFIGLAGSVATPLLGPPRQPR